MAFRALWHIKYEQIMRVSPASFQQLYTYFDFYLEEIVRLLVTSSKDEAAKYKLFEVIIHHQDSCVNEECFCHTGGVD